MSSLNIAEEMGVALPERAATTTHPTRTFLWSVRRELWENPSIVVAPAAVASLLVIATLVAAVRFTGPLLLKLGEQNVALSTVAIAPFIPVPMFLGITMVRVAIFYSLDALLQRTPGPQHPLLEVPSRLRHHDRALQDGGAHCRSCPSSRSSLPLPPTSSSSSSRTIALLTHHASMVSAWAGIPVLSLLGLMSYAAVVVTLWYAPIYAWFLLVSAWARRMPLLWAVIPFFLLAFFERIAFQTHYVRDFIGNRLGGFLPAAFLDYPLSSHTNLDVHCTPGHFLATPALWGGLLFAALALILIIRLRRSSDPI